MDQARVDWPGATLTECYRWFIVDERTGKRRLTTYKPWNGAPRLHRFHRLSRSIVGNIPRSSLAVPRRT